MNEIKKGDPTSKPTTMPLNPGGLKASMLNMDEMEISTPRSVGKWIKEKREEKRAAADADTKNFFRLAQEQEMKDKTQQKAEDDRAMERIKELGKQLPNTPEQKLKKITLNPEPFHIEVPRFSMKPEVFSVPKNTAQWHLDNPTIPDPLDDFGPNNKRNRKLDPDKLTVDPKPYVPDIDPVTKEVVPMKPTLRDPDPSVRKMLNDMDEKREEYDNLFSPYPIAGSMPTKTKTKPGATGLVLKFSLKDICDLNKSISEFFREEIKKLE